MLLPRLAVGGGLVTPVACTSALTSALAHEVINDLQRRQQVCRDRCYCSTLCSVSETNVQAVRHWIASIACTTRRGPTLWKEEFLKCSGLPDVPLPFSPATADRCSCNSTRRESCSLLALLAAECRADFSRQHTSAQGAEVLGSLWHDVLAELQSSTMNDAPSKQPDTLVYDGDDRYQLQFCRISIAHLHGDAAQRRAIRRHVEEHDCTSGGHTSCQQTQPGEECRPTCIATDQSLFQS